MNKLEKARKRFLERYCVRIVGSDYVEKKLNDLIELACIDFGKYFANRYNTETFDEDDIEEKVPKIYKEYSKDPSSKQEDKS